jgi:hypothetical protein
MEPRFDSLLPSSLLLMEHGVVKASATSYIGDLSLPGNLLRPTECRGDCSKVSLCDAARHAIGGKTSLNL